MSQDLPIIIVHQSGHLGVVNSKALEIMGFDASTEDPQGGVIQRGADGEPNGVLEEYAFFSALVPILSIRLDQEVFGTQTRSALTKAFAVSMSLRMIATMATFAGFPAARRASYFAFISGL